MRYVAIVSYDGSNYQGFQKQKNAIGIQDKIERAFALMTQTTIAIVAAGRTDKGVHAKGQVMHFDSELDLDERMRDAWNRRLPEDIRILKIKKVSKNFHARYDARAKKYIYTVLKNPDDVFKNRYGAYYAKLDITRILKAPKYLEGTHDFKGFCKYTEGKDTIRTLYELKITETKEAYLFSFYGKSFLRYMVRSLMGTLIEIAQHKKELTCLEEILTTKDRKKAGKTAEAKGLVLKKVYY